MADYRDDPRCDAVIEVLVRQRGRDLENIIGEGKSDAGPALALCIAALRARKEIA